MISISSKAARRQARLTLPLPAAWPRIDRLAWARVLAGREPFARFYRVSRYSGATRRKWETSYARWIAWLSEVGRLDRSVGPAKRVTPELLATYIADLQRSNAPFTVTHRVEELSVMLSMMAPRYDWSWVREISAQIRRAARPTRQKRDRIRPSVELVRFGLRLMHEAEKRQWERGHPPSVRFRDGLMIALLAARPIRLCNLTAICISKHLVRRGIGYQLAFSADETKTRHPLELPIPDALVPYLERYLTHYRALLLGCRVPGRRPKNQMLPPSRALWISERGTAMSIYGIRTMIVRRTKREFGVTIGPHLFRDCAVTSIAVDDPDNMMAAATVLGARTIRTVERFYNQATSAEALRRYHATILAMRAEARGFVRPRVTL